jgi:hypothetical protein
MYLIQQLVLKDPKALRKHKNAALQRKKRRQPFYTDSKQDSAENTHTQKEPGKKYSSYK